LDHILDILGTDTISQQKYTQIKNMAEVIIEASLTEGAIIKVDYDDKNEKIITSIKKSKKRSKNPSVN